MKNLSVLILLFVGFVLVSNSCNNEKANPEQEKRVDELIQELTSMEDTLKAVDMDSVLRMYDRVATRTNGLQTFISTLPEDREIRVKMSVHGDIHKIFQKYPKRHDELLKDIIERKESLKKLKSDLAIIEKDSIDYYIGFEKQKIENLKKDFGIVHGVFLKYVEMEKEVAPFINHLIDSLFNNVKSKK